MLKVKPAPTSPKPTAGKGNPYDRRAVCPPPGGFVNPQPITGVGQAAPQPKPLGVDAFVASHGGR